MLVQDDSIHDGLGQRPVQGGYGYLRNRVVLGSATGLKRHFIKVPDRPMRSYRGARHLQEPEKAE
jgi:hypothetical protein